MNTEEFIKEELNKTENPVGKLGEVIELLSTLPAMIPKSIVEDLMRLTFVGSYTEASIRLTEFHDMMVEDLIAMCKKYEDQFNGRIRNSISRMVEPVSEDD